MLPMVEVPETIRKGLRPYRDLFRRAEGFEHVSRYVTGLIESKGKHWVSELKSSRHLLWQNQWRQIDEVATELRQRHPESFRRVFVRCRNGEQKPCWVFTKSVRIKRYGRKRIAMVHERADLTYNLPVSGH